uniref:histone acetyltransferase n=1 Tax=Mesocestoides corti TaxID=53468 RepID=A0A5K3G2G7_MESCO
MGPRLSGHQLDFVNSLAGLFECPLPCRAVYLHTLCTNVVALRFYQRRGFVVHRLVPRCYLIDGDSADGYCCVLHINGGYPYRSMADECLQWLRQTISATRAAAVVVIARLARACDALSSYLLHSRRSIKWASSRLGLWLRGTEEIPVHSLHRTCFPPGHLEGIQCDNNSPLLMSSK